MLRHYTLLDRLITQFDQSLRTLTVNTVACQRPNPAALVAETALSKQEQRHSAGLMRVDHVGEVCAQALYQGQALAAKTSAVQASMQQAAQEEMDHLAWCQQRLQELHSRPSFLNPFWYTGALLMGIIAGVLGDRWSLGFVVATENQVMQHIDSHLALLPSADHKSRVILQQMREDEAHHATTALTAGATELPAPVQFAMRCLAKVMTTTAYWI